MYIDNTSRLLISAVFAAIVGWYIANLNNRNPWVWAVVCFLLPGVGVLFLMALGKPVEQPAARSSSSTWDIGIPTESAPVAERLEQTWWKHLKEIDADIRAAASEVSQMSADYEDVLADQFVAPGDKKDYLRSLVEAIKAQHAALVEQNVAEDEAAPALSVKRTRALQNRVDRSRAMMEEIAANDMICRQSRKKVVSMQLYAGRQIDDHGYAYLRYEDGTSELRSGDYFTLAPSDGP